MYCSAQCHSLCTIRSANCRMLNVVLKNVVLLNLMVPFYSDIWRYIHINENDSCSRHKTKITLIELSYDISQIILLHTMQGK